MRKLGLLMMMMWLMQIVSAQPYDTATVGDGYIVFKGDTTNRYNTHGKKDGKWVIIEKEKITGQTHSMTTNGCVAGTLGPFYEDVKVVEGFYRKGRRTGMWTVFGSGGKVWMYLNYRRGIPDDGTVLQNGKGAVVKPNENNTACIEYNSQGKVVWTHGKEVL